MLTCQRYLLSTEGMDSTSLLRYNVIASRNAAENLTAENAELAKIFLLPLRSQRALR